MNWLRWMWIASLLVGVVGVCGATSKYKIITSTKDIGYEIKGSQRYVIGPDSSTTGVVIISSYQVSFGGLLLQDATAPYANNSDKLDGYEATYFMPASSAPYFLVVGSGTLLEVRIEDKLAISSGTLFEQALALRLHISSGIVLEQQLATKVSSTTAEHFEFTLSSPYYNWSMGQTVLNPLPYNITFTTLTLQITAPGTNGPVASCKVQIERRAKNAEMSAGDILWGDGVTATTDSWKGAPFVTNAVPAGYSLRIPTSAVTADVWELKATGEYTKD